MTTNRHILPRRLPAVSALLALLAASGCVNAMDDMVVSEAVKPASSVDYGKAEECLARAMYFESDRSSPTGMLAVGTVVMNRVASSAYPNSVCDVVGQRSQFAPGVMTRPMGAGRELAMATARDVLSGKRHAGVKTAKYFHTAGYRFPYRNMNYVAIAGGNAFYQKVSRQDLASVRMASQSEIRERQKEAGEVNVATDVTAMAMAPTDTQPAAASPFASLWHALTEPKPEAPSRTASSSAGSSQAGKGGRVVLNEGGGQDDTLRARMNGLPGVSDTVPASYDLKSDGGPDAQLRQALTD